MPNSLILLEMDQPQSSDSKIVVTYRPQIDETNEEVQQLLEAEMGSIDECIAAIEMYGTAHLATNHMMMKEDETFFQDGSLQMQSNGSEIPVQEITRFVACYKYYYNNNVTIKHYSPDVIDISLGSVENEYLKLDALGKVLYKLRSDFPGMVSPARYYL